MFAMKPIEALHREAADANGLKRHLGAFDLVMLGVGVVVGAGIFVVTGRAAAVNAGPAVTISFVIAGFAAALAGLCYSEMASVMPTAGGTYSYTSATMGELIAFLIGWDLILEYLLGAALVSVSWSGYTVAFCKNSLGLTLPAAWTQAPVRWDEAAHAFVATGAYINAPAFCLIAVVTCILVRGVRESSRLNILVVTAKLCAIGLFVAFGIAAINPDNWTPFLPTNTGEFGSFGVSGIFQGASMVFLSYIGFDAISTAAQEARNPHRDLPRGILGSLAICVLLYVVVALVLTGVVSYTTLNVAHPIALGIEAIGRPWLETVVILGAIAGLSSGALVMLMGQPRIFMAMAKDGLFPDFATRIHPRFGTPHITTIGTGVVGALAGGLAPVDVLSELVSVGTLLAFMLVSLSVMVLRLRRPDLPRSFRVPGGTYLVPLSSAAISLCLIGSMPSRTLIRVSCWMALGLVFYVLYARHHSKFGAMHDAQTLRNTAERAR
jgi:APA family basic amino acid/polyamine antiporter